jgi:hypothetical protein
MTLCKKIVDLLVMQFLLCYMKNVHDLFVKQLVNEDKDHSKLVWP